MLNVRASSGSWAQTLMLCANRHKIAETSRNSCAKLATGWVITTISAIIVIHQQLATTISAIVIVLQQLAACATNSGFH